MRKDCNNLSPCGLKSLCFCGTVCRKTWARCLSLPDNRTGKRRGTYGHLSAETEANLDQAWDKVVLPQIGLLVRGMAIKRKAVRV